MNSVRTIRQAAQADIPMLVEFQRRMAIETENVTLDLDTVNDGASHLLADPAKGKYWIAEENNQIIGCLMTTFEWSDWRDGTVLWIQSVYVHENHRGKGVYKSMYEFIKQQVVADTTLKGIRLYVDRTNKKAQAIYTRLGMNGDHYQVFEWMK